MKNRKRLFGYGSLFNALSASKTLNRPVGRAEFELASLPGFVRSWSVAIPVLVGEAPSQRELEALFLDIKPCQGAACNGVILEVSDSELRSMDEREKQYQRVEYEVETQSGLKETAFVYMGKPRFQSNTGVILTRYLKMVESGAQSLGAEFWREFQRSTRRTGEVDLVSGNYQFRDQEQNKAIGRS